MVKLIKIKNKSSLEYNKLIKFKNLKLTDRYIDREMSPPDVIMIYELILKKRQRNRKIGKKWWALRNGRLNG